MNHYTDAEVQAGGEAVLEHGAYDPELASTGHLCIARDVITAVAPAIAARALRNLADAMENGWIDSDDLRYKTSDAPKGWVEACVAGAWESQSIWAPYLRYRADEIEAGQP